MQALSQLSYGPAPDDTDAGVACVGSSEPPSRSSGGAEADADAVAGAFGRASGTTFANGQTDG